MCLFYEMCALDMLLMKATYLLTYKALALACSVVVILICDWLQMEKAELVVLL